jgi:predicted dehydrogenase
VEAVTRVGHAGLGDWGKNVVRVIGELGELVCVCDTNEERLRDFGGRFAGARATTSFDEMLADESIEAVTIATPVPTHFDLARRALHAGKHVFVEKPPAMRADEMSELVKLARERALVLMPGHLLLYHPGVRKLKELVDGGHLGDVLCVYGNRQNLGTIRSYENALWSLGVHDLSVILWLLGEEPSEVVAHGSAFLQEGVEDVVFCFLRFPSGKVAHMHLSWLDPHKMRKMTVVGREKMAVFDDMELERKVKVYDKAPWEPAETYGEWRTRTGDIFSPKITTDEPLRLELEHFLRLVSDGPGEHREALDGLMVVNALDRLTRSLRGASDGDGEGAGRSKSDARPAPTSARP